MLSGQIPNANLTLGPPKNWDDKARGGRSCGSLAVRAEETPVGHTMTSAWFPTDEELQRLNSGAPVHLTVLTQRDQHPPVVLAVGQTPADPNQLPLPDLPVAHRVSA